MLLTDESATRPAHRALTVKAFGITDKGRVRPSNEDQFLSAELTKAMRIWQTSLPEPKAQFGEERGHLFLVADGMGGHARRRTGQCPCRRRDRAVHAQYVQVVLRLERTRSAGSPHAVPVGTSPGRRTHSRGSTEHPELRGMGTTVTMAFQLDTQLCVVHVGDSRAYLYGDGELYQVTHDHTLMAEMVSRGELQPEQAAQHRLRHVITNVVGGTEAVVNVEAHALEVHAGDRLLLCSDGLTEMVTTRRSRPSFARRRIRRPPVPSWWRRRTKPAAATISPC